MPKNLIQHVEWSTRDPSRLKSFYGRIFDWKFQEAMPGYTMIDGVGGIFTIPPDQQMPICVINYVTVDDLASKEEQVKAAGGTIHKSKQEVPGMGWFTMFGDPDGNIVSMWQAMNKPAKAAAPKKSKAKAKQPAKKAQPAKKRKKK